MVKSKPPKLLHDEVNQWEEKALHFSGLAIIWIAIFSLAFTILKEGFPGGHDIINHTIAIRLFLDALNEGQFPVRWTEWIWPGASIPLFNFYQVGFYYLIAFLHTLIPSTLETIKVSLVALWWLGSIMMFLFLRRWGSLAASFGALVFATVPYLCVDLFIRGAYPEFMAVVFVVSILWVLDRLLTDGKIIYSLALSVFLSIVAVTHPPTLLMASPLLISLSLWQIFNSNNRRALISKLSLSVILSLGLSAFFLLPVLLEINHVQIFRLQSNIYDYHGYFTTLKELFVPSWGYAMAPDPNSMSYQLGTISWIIVSFALLAIIVSRINGKFTLIKKRQPYLIFWLLALGYSLFMSSKYSEVLWNTLPLLSFIQYPFRFLTTAVLSVSVIAGLLFSLLEIKKQLFIIVITIISIIIFYGDYFSPSAFVDIRYFNLDLPQWRESQAAHEHRDYGEGYLPLGVEKYLGKKTAQRYQFTQGDGQVTEQGFKSHHQTYLVETSQPTVFRINVHYFPGWQVLVDSQPVVFDHSPPYGYMSVNLPSGKHLVETVFTDTPIRKAANLISLISLAILLGLSMLVVLSTLRTTHRSE